jgi:hypothetical protein
MRRTSHPRATYCAEHGFDRILGCDDCQRAREAKAFWDSLDRAIGFDLGPTRRRRIGHLLDYPYGAPKVKRRVDIIIAGLAIIIADKGSWPDVFPLRNEPKTKAELLGFFNKPSFPRFLLFIWDELPRTSDCRRASEFQFLRAANSVLRQERPARRRDVSASGSN